MILQFECEFEVGKRETITSSVKVIDDFTIENSLTLKYPGMGLYFNRLECGSFLCEIDLENINLTESEFVYGSNRGGRLVEHFYGIYLGEFINKLN